MTRLYQVRNDVVQDLVAMSAHAEQLLLTVPHRCSWSHVTPVQHVMLMCKGRTSKSRDVTAETHYLDM